MRVGVPNLRMHWAARDHFLVVRGARRDALEGLWRDCAEAQELPSVTVRYYGRRSTIAIDPLTRRSNPLLTDEEMLEITAAAAEMLPPDRRYPARCFVCSSFYTIAGVPSAWAAALAATCARIVRPAEPRRWASA